MLKTIVITLILSLNAQADINVACKTSCPDVPGSTLVTNTPSQTVIKIAPNPDEDIAIETEEGTPKKRIVVEVDEDSQPGNIQIDLSSKIDPVELKSFDASNGLVVGAYLKSVSVNTSGFRGANGKSASDLCADKVLDGTYDTNLGTGTAIHTFFMTRRTDPSVPQTRCDQTDIDFIKAQIAPDNTSGVASPMCSNGYITDPSANASTIFSLRRISNKRACINNPTTGRQCRFRKHRFQCGFGFGPLYGLIVTEINGKDGARPNIILATKRVFAPFFAPGVSPTSPAYYSFANTGMTCHNDCKTGTRVDGWADNFTFQTLGEKYYEEKWISTDCSDSSCTVSQFRESGVNYRAQASCAATWTIGFGTGCYGPSQGVCTRGANWTSGWPGTSANAFYLGLQEINEISSSTSESCDALAVRKGYSTTYTTEDLGPAVGSNTTWMPEASACPVGFTNAGTYNDFSTCTDGSGSALCDSTGDEDSITCSSMACAGGKMVVNNKSYAPLAVTLEEGQKGSNFGTATVVAFYVEGSATSTVLGGSDGNTGTNDLNVVGEPKVCKMVEDEDYFDQLTAPGKAASRVASFRSIPRVFIENVSLKPLEVIGATFPKATFQNPKPNQNKTFTHVDANVRKLILKEAQ